MQINRSSILLFLSRLVVQPALLISLITLLAGLYPAAVVAESEASTSTELSLTYRWNLNDDRLPLINLPDHIAGGVDLSLTYSMDQYQFPLFNSLYHNQQMEKYVLVVMPKQNPRRLEFINMTTTEDQFVAENSNLRLTDKGFAKQISTDDGTVYTFTPVGDGQLHCSQITSQGGVLINLKYTNNGSIDNIVDAAGRTINFGYTDEFVSSITQTWGAGVTRRKTWAIGANAALPTTLGANLTVTGPAAAKLVPTNAITPNYTETMAASDLILARIFGGPGAVAAANGFEPTGLSSQYPLYRGDLIGDDGKIRRGHLSYAMHLYGSPDGQGETALYVPAGYVSHSSQPTPTDAAVTFYYPRLGNITNVTLAVFHVANFQMSEENGRVRIGTIGGPGGSVATYKHSHMEFYRGDTGLPRESLRAKLRIDPNAVFSSRPNA